MGQRTEGSSPSERKLPLCMKTDFKESKLPKGQKQIKVIFDKTLLHSPSSCALWAPGCPTNTSKLFVCSKSQMAK